MGGQGKALAGVRILDLSRVLAGPWATQMLGDLGAEIIKVERPGAGDDTRAWGPPWLKDEAGNETTESAYYLSANRGKKSVTIDLATPEGADLVRRLARKSDVVVENYKLGSLKKYGLDYETLSAADPRLIYCSITGFGQDGPRAPQAGYDLMIQALSGFMSITGEADGSPQRAGVAIVDVMTGLHAVIAILAALNQRHATGKGQRIDLALFDVALSVLANQSMSYLVSGEAPGRLGNAHPSVVPYQSFATADGDIILAIGNDAQFARFAALGGRPDLATDVRFVTNGARVRNRAQLIPIFADIIARRTTADWVAALEAASIPHGPINTLAEAFADRQAVHRGIVQRVPHPLGGSAPQVASPLKLSASPVEGGAAPPLLGQHSSEVLADLLGMSGEDIEGLAARGVI